MGEESTRGVGIPGESVPCSPRLHGFSARACVSLFAKPLRVGEEDFAFPFLFFPLSFQPTSTTNSTMFDVCVGDFDKRITYWWHKVRSLVKM